MKRMQRLHMMQRSSSSRIRGPISTFFGFLTFMSTKRDTPRPCSTECS